ncbi:uncharacterized protein LOC123558948 [Mercenaria mercenaria]|uniref:uncharacterized protein LOC123558948 n=1 Tax=Mercenaria mercenaria TaxID=6596 RepID=UPI00234EB78A|nr:uncharacterized protein LOC123558948 [Mercenaria mercenaria]
MAEEKEKIHCLHVCGHIEAMLEEKATKEYEEKMEARKPIQCSTEEDSGQLHEIYKDRVKGTEPSEEKAKMIQEMMEAIEHAKLVHSMTLLRAKEEEHGLKRHPSTLSHMHHDDSDSEGEVEDLPHPDTENSADATSVVNVDDTATADEATEVAKAVDSQAETDAETNLAVPEINVVTQSGTEVENMGNADRDDDNQ